MEQQELRLLTDSCLATFAACSRTSLAAFAPFFLFFAILAFTNSYSFSSTSLVAVRALLALPGGEYELGAAILNPRSASITGYYQTEE